MRNISDLKENEVIHCRTQEEWDGVLEMFNPLKLTTDLWKNCKENSVIFNDGCYGDISGADYLNLTIIPASEFVIFAPSISISKQIGEYTLLKHDGKIFVIKDSQAITLTTEIINAIKEMI